MLNREIMNELENERIRTKSWQNKNMVLSLNLSLELPDRSYSISDIQDCFKYIIKKHETQTDNHQFKNMSAELRTEHYMQD